MDSDYMTDSSRQHVVLCEIVHELKRIADALERMATPVLTMPQPYTQPYTPPYTQPYQPYVVVPSPTVAPPSLPTYTCCSDIVRDDQAHGCSGDPA